MCINPFEDSIGLLFPRNEGIKSEMWSTRIQLLKIKIVETTFCRNIQMWQIEWKFYNNLFSSSNSHHNWLRWLYCKDMAFSNSVRHDGSNFFHQLRPYIAGHPYVQNLSWRYRSRFLLAFFVFSHPSQDLCINSCDR